MGLLTTRALGQEILLRVVQTTVDQAMALLTIWALRKGILVRVVQVTVLLTIRARAPTLARARARALIQALELVQAQIPTLALTELQPLLRLVDNPSFKDQKMVSSSAVRHIRPVFKPTYSA